ncbi:hypothetical protein STEG23_008703, partial [Scotinomys teguina]
MKTLKHHVREITREDKKRKKAVHCLYNNQGNRSESLPSGRLCRCKTTSKEDNKAQHGTFRKRIPWPTSKGGKSFLAALSCFRREEGQWLGICFPMFVDVSVARRPHVDASPETLRIKNNNYDNRNINCKQSIMKLIVSPHRREKSPEYPVTILTRFKSTSFKNNRPEQGLTVRERGGVEIASQCSYLDKLEFTMYTILVK